VKIKPLAEPAIKAVREKRIRIIPETWENTYFSWMENIQDWCISRQIWWGHRIPAWLCEGCGKFTVEKTDPTECSHCGSKKIKQETDVLDTWFSSALWPFSTLGWPEKTEELKAFYPTSVLITGFDILFFWVARMIMMGLKFMGDVPFRDVYIHALVRDEHGQKMSKSKGNIVDPLNIIDKYGADSFRFTLAAMAAQGRDIKLSEERIEGYRNFVNKIWNAFRFAFVNLKDPVPQHYIDSLITKPLQIPDRWIMGRLQKTIKETKKGLDAYRFNDSAHALYQFFWHEVCDWYIELIKSRLQSTGEKKETAQAALIYVLENSLRLLHPFMPFITEELWQKLPHTGESISVMPYPEYDADMEDIEAEAEMDLMMNICRQIRNIRSEMNIPPGKRLDVLLRLDISDQNKTNDAGNKKKIIERHFSSITTLARLNTIRFDSEGSPPQGSASAITDSIEIFVLLDGVIDISGEEKRLTKEITKIQKDLQFLEKKLSNAKFVENAPAEVVEKNRKKLADLQSVIKKLEENRNRIEAIQS